MEFINFEEGRIRPVTPVAQNNGLDALSIDGNITLPNNQKGAYDYFIRDYQQNVRMILTEETHSGTNTCTMESSRASIEDGMFGQTGTNNEVEITRSPKPSGWNSNSSSSVSELSALKHKVGPNVLLKVMASDQITATSQYYYAAPVTNGVGNNLTSDILTTLIQNLLGSTLVNPLAKGNNTLIQNQLNGNTSFSNITAPDAGNSAGNAPKAYMTVMFFDERFNFISENSSSIRVSQAGDGAPPLALTNVKAPKNGYAYVYLSNESNQSVYFDNLVVNDNRGRIIEEDHYYAFGLKIAAISSKKLADPNEDNVQNNNQYQGDFSEFDEDLGWNDFDLRNYDPQIARWVQQDPYDQYPSPYTGMGNNPVSFADPSGGFSINLGTIGQITGNAIVDRALITVAGAAIGFGVDKLTGGNGWRGATIGGAVSLAGTFIPPFSISDIGILLGKEAPSLAIQGIKVGTDVINQTQSNPLAHWAGYNQQHPLTIDNTKEALNHYLHGNGESVNIGPNTTFALLTSPEFKYREERIISGKTKAMNGNFSVDMTKKVFHIGRTNIDYSISCGIQNCTVRFSLFVRDGFWDVDFIDENSLGKIGIKRFQADGMGPNLERLDGHPYRYNPVYIKFTFINPGYKPN